MGVIATLRALSAAFGRLAKRAGMPARNFHVTRHSHASELLRLGVTVPAVAERLGHRGGGALLLKTYARTTDAVARNAAQRLGNLFGKLQQSGRSAAGTTRIPVAFYASGGIIGELAPPCRPVSTRAGMSAFVRVSVPPCTARFCPLPPSLVANRVASAGHDKALPGRAWLPVMRVGYALYRLGEWAGCRSAP